MSNKDERAPHKKKDSFSRPDEVPTVELDIHGGSAGSKGVPTQGGGGSSEPQKPSGG